MNTLQILVVLMAVCCASQGRHIRSRRFVNQPPSGLFPPGNNHLDIQAIMALLKNPMMMKGLGQVNSQQQQQQQPQQQQQQLGTGQIPQAEVTQHTKNQGQVQGQTPTQNGGHGQQGHTNNGQTQQVPVPAPTANTLKTVDPMQQLMGSSNMFTDPMFLQYLARRVNMMKPKYRRGDFIPQKGLFPGGYVISADGSDAEVRDIYGRLHSIDGGIFQA